MYTSGAIAGTISNIMVRVDDSNLTRWDYSDNGRGWRLGGDPRTFNFTGHSSFRNGSQMKFRFNGTFVQLVGYILPYTTKNETSIPRLSFSLDNQLFTYTPPSSVQETLYDQTFFTSSRSLTDDEHELTIVYLHTQDPPELWLDYIEYIPGRLDSESTPNGTSTVQSSPTGQLNSNVDSLSVGAVAGLSVAVVMTLVIIAVLGFFWWRRRKRRARRHVSAEQTLDPFDLAIGATRSNGSGKLKRLFRVADGYPSPPAHATPPRPPLPLHTDPLSPPSYRSEPQ
ncbi:hypothetical protein V5O48_009867 [Marasmius crinis-equi]|uniref:Uncharacterized protein n=1 Tax=Marasmius crinis-equi TaxID=585013 RepID=A0ABR3F9Z6_9AGAR